MSEATVDNRAQDVPFSFVIADLLSSNLEQRPEKMRTFSKMWGVVGLNLPDIDAAITMIFAGGRVRIEPGIVGKPDIVITSSSEKIISLNSISIKFGLPYYFDEAGLAVLRQLATGELKIQGMFTHPVLLTRLTKIMSVM
ncbi:MAG TPA: hypothetical protein PLS81_04940 [Deltaproteobacteria bacterium]|nr:hypothetical protein [Deltaproteobacteria bacterium]HOM28784.1 hypothetical protein [Deltaproteobacteria bacterium]